MTLVLLDAVLLALVVGAGWRDLGGRRVPLWLPCGFLVVALLGFLVWAADDATLPVPSLLIGALALSVPMIFGALGGVISERVGVVNVAIEGQLLAGAFVSAVVTTVVGHPVVGLVSAALAGALVASVLGVMSTRYWVDQVIVGVVLNVLVGGITAFLYSSVLSQHVADLNAPERLPALAVPVLSRIPVVGPAFFQQTAIVYLAYAAVAAVWFGLFRTRWGLRVRAVGEHPQAADTVGIAVNLTRFRNVALAGAIAGLGGAYFTLGSVGAFQRNMTAGVGYIALAAVIFGRWDPIRATVAALLFGFAMNLQYVLGVIGSPVPSEFLLMFPYLVTVIAVSGVAGHVRGPAAAGAPYRSG
ncbi:unannotated protein [freshwater metagenome]|uniref:Unannotated protein n=1 Tax=freshwater metagenome TaxID=449393 RepID=A0A6J6PUD6_9ZZZZ